MEDFTQKPILKMYKTPESIQMNIFRDLDNEDIANIFVALMKYMIEKTQEDNNELDINDATIMMAHIIKHEGMSAIYKRLMMISDLYLLEQEDKELEVLN